MKKILRISDIEKQLARLREKFGNLPLDKAPSIAIEERWTDDEECEKIVQSLCDVYSGRSTLEREARKFEKQKKKPPRLICRKLLIE